MLLLQFILASMFPFFIILLSFCNQFRLLFLLFSIFTEERLERLTKSIGDMDLESSVGFDKDDKLEENFGDISPEPGLHEMLNGAADTSHLSTNSGRVRDDERRHSEHQFLKEHLLFSQKDGSNDATVAIDTETDLPANKVFSAQLSECCDTCVDDVVTNKQPAHRHLPNAVLPLLRYQQYESSESSSRYMNKLGCL